MLYYFYLCVGVLQIFETEKECMDMCKFEDLIGRRRSYRVFTGEDISADDVRLIPRAALLSPSAMKRRSWQFVVVDDRTLLDKLADAKDGGAQFLRGASLAVVVFDNPLTNDCWIEDCSIAAVMMQLQAEALGLGSCWAHMRGRGLSDGTSADDVIHGILGVPDEQKVLCVIGFGHKGESKDGHDDDSLKWENVHVNDEW